jgi:NAD(P)H-hydrate epimerase
MRHDASIVAGQLSVVIFDASSMLVLTRSQVRSVDQRAIDDYGMSGLVLMENAGRGCVDELISLGVSGPVVIACGKGNNGGDGFVIARHLDNRGFEVRVLHFGDAVELKGDALANYNILVSAAVPIEQFAGTPLDADALERIHSCLASANLIVDALLGTGATGAPREPLATAIRLINDAAAPKLAIDIPSGLDCDSGEAANPTVIADHTCTFVAMKPGLLSPSAARYCGTLHVIDIGVPRKLVAEIVAAGQRD